MLSYDVILIRYLIGIRFSVSDKLKQNVSIPFSYVTVLRKRGIEYTVVLQYCLQPELSKDDTTPLTNQVKENTLHIGNEGETELLEIKSVDRDVEEFENGCCGTDEAQKHSGIEEVSLANKSVCIVTF